MGGTLGTIAASEAFFVGFVGTGRVVQDYQRGVRGVTDEMEIEISSGLCCDNVYREFFCNNPRLLCGELRIIWVDL